MTRRLSGRLVQAQAGEPVPVRNARLAVVVHAHWWLDPVVAPIETDEHGCFSFEVAGPGACDATLTVLEERRIHTKGGPRSSWRPLVSRDVHFATDSIGDVPVSVWPYRTDFESPRSGWMNGVPCQSYTTAYKERLYLSFARATPTKALLLAEHKLAPSGPSLSTIQSHQPVTEFLERERAEPGITRSDAWLADQLLNGFDVELLVGRDADDPEQWRVRITWPPCASKNTYDLADVDVQLADHNGTLVPVRIDVHNRRPSPEGWRLEPRTHLPGSPDWEGAKRIVRCQMLLHGALYGHILRTHLQTEMYAIAVFRNVRKNPILHLLAPHLQEVVAQNHDGDGFAWGPDGILAVQSALPMDAIQGAIRASLGSWDWSTFRPRSPVHPTHRYAHAAGEYWQMLTEVYSAWIDEHRAEIALYWGEILGMSRDLVSHAPVYQPGAVDPHIVPVDRNELDHPEPPRPMVAGSIRALREITTREAPEADDFERLLQVCCYIVFQATFNHTWTHDGQYQAGGELAYATFALRNGSYGEEDDPTIAPDPAAAIESITTNTIGIHANYGFLLADEERDVPPSLKRALEHRRQVFNALGVDVDRLRSRINI